MNKYIDNIYKNKIRHCHLTIDKNNDGFVQFNKKEWILLCYNYNISNYTKCLYIKRAKTKTNINDIVIIPNSITKYKNKCPQNYTTYILPNSIIYYIDNSHKNSKKKIKINKHIIYNYQWIKQKYHIHTIFLHVVHINMFKNKIQNFLINETKEIIFNLYVKVTKKLYFYDCFKLTINASIINNSITNIYVSRGMKHIVVYGNGNDTIFNDIIFYDVTKFLQKYFIYKIHLCCCKMTNNVLCNFDESCYIIPKKYHCFVEQCTRNYNFLRNSYEFKIHNATLNLTNLKNYYYLLLVKNITANCIIIYDTNFIKTFDDIKNNLKQTVIRQYFGDKTDIKKINILFDKTFIVRFESHNHKKINSYFKLKKCDKYIKMFSRITNI